MKHLKHVLSIVAILMVASRACGALSAEGAKSVRLVLPAQAGPVIDNIGRVFARQVQQRCEAMVVTAGAAPLTAELAVEKSIGAEGYRVEDRPGGGVRIAGNDERGLVAGVGKFLRTSRYDKGGFTPGTWRGTSVPTRQARGIYDQGGCGCAECKPWGSKGFMKCVEEVGNLARTKLPGTKVVLSTWMIDQGEWSGMLEQFARTKGLADEILFEPSVGPRIDPKNPGLPMFGFPEISMHNTFPWGGFGATPLTAHAQGQWNAAKGASRGGFPYSEGIYEDLTKAVYSQFYWNDQTAAETLKEYIAFEYSPDVVDEIAGVVKTLEQNHHWRWWPGELEGVKLEMDWFPSKGAKPQADPGAEDAYATMRRIDGLLTPQAKQAWRWRQLYLRALLDAELKANGGKPNERCNAAFAELIKIYHAENANPAVRPPLPKDYQGKK